MMSTDLVSQPKDQWKQSTGKWRRSTTDLVGRSTAVWHNSKYHYHQSTMEMWHRSTDTWNQSKDRCQQSAKSMLYRSILRWNQATDQLHHAARIEDSKEHAMQGQIEEQTSSSSPQSPQSRFYSQRSSTSQSTSPTLNTKCKSTATKAKSTSSSVAHSSLSSEQQLRGFYESTVLVRSLVAQAKQARDEKQESMGEIELEWINSTISDAENAANELFAFVGPFWVHHFKEEAQVSSQDSKIWGRHDYQCALKKESRMIHSHNRLETVLGHLGALKVTLNPKDGTVFTTSTVASVTPVVAELSCEAQVVPVFELPSSPPVPKIIVTHYDKDDVDDIAPVTGSPPPSYEASRMNGTEELQ